MPKILTQCTTTDFKQVIERSLSKKEGDSTPNLPPKHKAALLVVTVLIHAGLSFEEICNIREVIFWDNKEWIWKFHHTPEAQAVKFKLSQTETRNLIQEKLIQVGTKLDKEK